MELTDKNEQPQEIISRTLKDAFLDDYAAWANKGITQGITISVNGIIYTGVIIGSYAWCNKMISSIAASGNSDKAKEAMIAYYKGMRDDYFSDVEKANLNINFIHMDNVRIVSGNSIGALSTLWRFKIEEIDGFSLGF
ncbi:TPA: hypothetical protein ACXI7C_000408 [Serratia marcescens]|uniref:hypothetical protein n=1 Tax=Serratia marcescens TaxID=615 RepID=UPI000F7EBD89|nr:hypothetical protein [Serratia marcescens]RTF27191.1 hypothetical protein D9B84_00835 [Serratia marcescens]